MKTTICAMSVLVLFTTPCAVAAGSDVTVAGTGDPAADVANVQAAVDSIFTGGTVVLRGDFDFGEGTVFVDKDVTLVGETAGQERLTTITGGYRAFAVGMLPTTWAYDLDADETCRDLTDLDVPVTVAIRDLRFVGSRAYSIFVHSHSGLEVTGCRFVDPQVMNWGWWAVLSGTAGFPMAKGIQIGSGTLGFCGGASDSTFEGPVLIAGNVFDGHARSGDPDGIPFSDPAVLWNGMNVAVGVFANEGDVTVRDNVIRDVALYGGIFSAIQGTLAVTRNSVAPGAGWPGGGQGMVVMADGFFGEGDPEALSVFITHNDIAISEGMGEAIVLQDAVGAVVKSNRIHVRGGAAAAITLWAGLGHCSGNLIGQNKLEGSGVAGILMDSQGVVIDHNVCQANNIELFTPLDGGAHHYLGADTFDNVIIGDPGVVIDLGIGNAILGH